MPPSTFSKRKHDNGPNAKIRSNKKFKKQKFYHSDSSGDEHDGGAMLAARMERVGKTARISQLTDEKNGEKSLETSLPDDKTPGDQDLEQQEDDDEDEDNENAEGDEDDESELDSEDDDDGDGDQTASGSRSKPKRNDPFVFSNSINAILSSKLTTSKRDDPVLSRSKTAQEATHSISESRLEVRARKKLRDEKKAQTEKGRVKDVLLGDRNVLVPETTGDGAEVQQGMTAAEITEQEKRLRKTAQRGVVKLFNAVRAAQVKGEEAAREARKRGVVGIKQREEKASEMGRQAFLDLVASGGKTSAVVT